MWPLKQGEGEEKTTKIWGPLVGFTLTITSWKVKGHGLKKSWWGNEYLTVISQLSHNGTVEEVLTGEYGLSSYQHKLLDTQFILSLFSLFLVCPSSLLGKTIWLLIYHCWSLLGNTHLLDLLEVLDWAAQSSISCSLVAKLHYEDVFPACRSLLLLL